MECSVHRIGGEVVPSSAIFPWLTRKIHTSDMVVAGSAPSKRVSISAMDTTGSAIACSATRDCSTFTVPPVSVERS